MIEMSIHFIVRHQIDEVRLIARITHQLNKMIDRNYKKANSSAINGLDVFVVEESTLPGLEIGIVWDETVGVQCETFVQKVVEDVIINVVERHYSDQIDYTVARYE